MLFMKTECLTKPPNSKQLARDYMKKNGETDSLIYVKALGRHIIALGTLL